MTAQNQVTYQRRSIVHYYTQLKQLQPAEQTVLELFQTRLASMKMLDIGVGGGRTTEYFSPLVAEYVGVDYAAEMITACQQRFQKVTHPIVLSVADARKMPQFADSSFDFILFSFNGIDYVNHQDRLNILQEVRRIVKPGGYFCFSSHNLQGLTREFDYKSKFSLNPVNTYTNLVMLALLRGLNPTVSKARLREADYLVVRDESHNFRLQTYYIRPQAQLQQLDPYFSYVEVYSWKTGQKITDQTELLNNQDMWLYYLCRLD
jgi:ubiquinone/menaquinone biosynthesis C-methylase UbiE